MSHVQRLSKITTPVWMVLISSIKKQLVTNWTASHLMGVTNALDYFLISVVNLHVIYKVLHPKGIELLDFKIVLATSLIGTYNNSSRNTPVRYVSRREVLPASVPLHLPVLQTTRAKCRYCYTGGTENKTYIQCNICGAFLSLISGNRSRNCFANFHTEV